MTLLSRLPSIGGDAKRPISIRPLHPFAEIDALSSGVFHFNESGTFRAWRAVEDDIDVIHWGYLSVLLSRAARSRVGVASRLGWLLTNQAEHGLAGAKPEEVSRVAARAVEFVKANTA